MSRHRFLSAVFAAGTVIWVTGCGCKCPPPPSCPTQPRPSAYAAPTATDSGQPTEVAPTAQPSPPPPPATAPGSGTATPGELAQLQQSLARNIAQRNAKGCQGDLAKLRGLDARYESTLVMQRAQCDMVSGRCKAGRAGMTQFFAQQTNMSAEQADRSVEMMTTQYCPESKMTKREQLSRAAQLLSRGAYSENRLDCGQNIAKVKRLSKQVKPRGPNDTTTTNWQKSLFHMGANCYARTGNCTAAWKVFKAEYPTTNLAKLKPDTREKVLKQTFGALVRRCKDAPLP